MVQSTLKSFGLEVSRQVFSHRESLGKNARDERIVFEYLRDYPEGLTVSEFLVRLTGFPDPGLKLKFRPRFSELFGRGFLVQERVKCSVDGKNVTKYRLKRYLL